ncbi:hypothetical protein NEOKW01_0357 [Nematocida sp. AWRm80]|nr:hypothetical protein NEOKW01_0357 [Nematocida sp. AWRm80]
MFSKETINSLPAEIRKKLAKLTERLKEREITHSEYKKACNALIEEAKEKEAEEESREKEKKKGKLPGKDDQKSEYMSDVIQYAGVNLKEEAMNIASEDAFHFDDSKGAVIDSRNTIESLFDPHAYVYFVKKICSLRDIGISEDAIYAIFQACRRKLFDILESLIEQSKLRMDLARSDYLIRIENDRRRQIWYLEQEERLEMDKYRPKKDGDDGDSKKKWRKALQEREDLLIKKRLSNNVALAALGSQPKSWMFSNAPTADDGSAPYLTLFQGTDERAQKTNTRIIIKEDFLAVLGRDKRYNKSVFTIKHTYL